MEHYELRISQLSCMSCFHNIEDVLIEHDSNIKAKADIRNQLLRVETSLSKEKIIDLIKVAGYSVDG